MSYARFGWDNSDVYVFLSYEGHLECCACLLGDDWRFASTGEMIVHLERHRAAGHCVPPDCIDGLLIDEEENDHWIANHRQAESECGA